LTPSAKRPAEQEDLVADVELVSRIPAVSTILEVVCRTTGMGFAAVARVTEERWVACSVLDKIDFGLKPGGELDLRTTICHEIRQSRQRVVIGHVAHDEAWRHHATPAMYGFQSYISVPIVLADGSFFGTLCAIDPRPARVESPEIIGMFELFAELLGKHLDASLKLDRMQSALVEEREAAELREQFIAVLGHDLRSPLRAIRSLTDLMLRTPLDDRTQGMVQLMSDSSRRMQVMIDNLLDLARSRTSAGMVIQRNSDEPLAPVLKNVIAEMQVNAPGRAIEAEIDLAAPVDCDRNRIGRLFSNLLGNAISYGSADQPIRVRAHSDADAFELSVANSGDPIPSAAQAHLFQPFHRSAVTRNAEGLGLGLFIANQVAMAHGGALSVSSTEQETKFTFRMPLLR
jgi:signal transduction histidine kinase